MMIGADPSPTPLVSSSSDLAAVLAAMKAAQRKHGPPSADERIRSLDRLERALVSRKTAIAAAVSRDFGSRSTHET
ncbi:MAG: hypothetical protein WBY94_03795, partial [Polyangiaceae bacterium]